MKANGYNAMESSGGHSAAWIRRSLNLLQSSLNRPSPLPCVDEDGDEEMEIDEGGVDDHDVVFCSANVLNNCNILAENDKEMNTDDQVLAEPCEAKNTPGCSGSKCLNEESSSTIGRSSFACPVGESDIGDFTGFPAPDASIGSPSAAMSCVSPASLSIVQCDSSPVLKSPTPSVSPRISSSRKSLRTSSGISPPENGLHVESDLGIKTGNKKNSSTALSSQTAPNFLTKSENLVASIRHGLKIIDSHQRNAALRPSYRFSLQPRESRLNFPADKVDVGVQTFLDDYVKEDSVLFTCDNCKSRMQVDVNENDNSSNLQLVPLDCSESADKPKKQVLKVSARTQLHFPV